MKMEKLEGKKKTSGLHFTQEKGSQDSASLPMFGAQLLASCLGTQNMEWPFPNWEGLVCCCYGASKNRNWTRNSIEIISYPPAIHMVVTIGSRCLSIGMN